MRSLTLVPFSFDLSPANLRSLRNDSACVLHIYVMRIVFKENHMKEAITTKRQDLAYTLSTE